MVSSSLRHCASALGNDLYLHCLGARSCRLLTRYHPISRGVRRMAPACFVLMIITGFSCRIETGSCQLNEHYCEGLLPQQCSSQRSDGLSLEGSGAVQAVLGRSFLMEVPVWLLNVAVLL